MLALMAAVAASPASALAPNASAAWNRLAEAWWASRDQNFFSEYREAASQAARFIWENPETLPDKMIAVEREQIRVLIASGNYRPLSL